MKKFFLVAALVAASSLGSFAAIMTGTCGSADMGNTANAGTPINIACPGFTVAAGEQVTSIVLTFYGSYSGGNISATDQAAFTFSITNNGSFSTWSSFSNPYNTTSGGPEPTSQVGFTAAAPISATTVGQTGVITGPTGTARFAVVQGMIASTNFNFTLTYDYTTALIPSGIPEPTTVALIGAGLVGLATAARRRRS